MRRAAALLLMLSALVWVGGCMRLLLSVYRQPSPARYLIAGDMEDGSPPRSCDGRILVDGAAFWRTCESHDAGSWLMRIDLAKKRADAWRLPPGPDSSRVVAAARHGEAGIAMVLFDGQVLVASQSDGIQVLGRVPARGRACGIAWVEDTVEIVTCGGVPDRIYGFPRRSPRVDRPAPAHPPYDQAAHDQRLELAVRGPDGWVSTFFRYPREVATLRSARIEIFEVAENAIEAPAQPTQTVVLDLGSDPEGKTANWFRSVDVDGAPGGATRWSSHLYGRFFERVDGVWGLLAPPSDHGSGVLTLDASYRLEARGLTLLPRWDDLTRHRVRIGTDWYDLERVAGGLRVSSDSVTGPLLTDDVRLDGQAELFPSTEGRLWLVGAMGAYVELTPRLSRADPPGAFERLGLLYESFDHWRDYDDDYASSERWKKAAMPTFLLLFPILWLVAAPVMWVPRLRARRHQIVAAASLLYLLAALATLSSFWWMTSHL